MKYIYSILALTILLVSCTDEVTIPSRFGDPELVVDAWVTIDDRPQTIRLTYSQDFIDSTDYKTENKASVVINNLTAKTQKEFAYKDNGNYVFDGILGAVGDSMQLVVKVGTETYESFTKVHRSPEPDSIVFTFEEKTTLTDEGIYAELYARDFKGAGDTYWIKTYRNGKLLNRPSELNVVYDASGINSGSDGVNFIKPVRTGINETDRDGNDYPFSPKEKLRCEIHSISNTAYYFLNAAQEQATNGDNTIFAAPVVNAQGNVYNVKTKKFVLGIFNVAKVTFIEETVK